jgi:hypothetical protein
MVKQREHEFLGYFAVLNKPSPPEGGAKLPKRANQATGVSAFFKIAARVRIGEKDPAFSAGIDHNGPTS